MRSGFAMVLFSFGLLCFGWGFVVLVLGTLGGHFGTPHPKALPITMISFVAAAILIGGSIFLNRSASRR
jgi:hypothetical protein